MNSSLSVNPSSPPISHCLSVHHTSCHQPSPARVSSRCRCHPTSLPLPTLPRHPPQRLAAARLRLQQLWYGRVTVHERRIVCVSSITLCGGCDVFYATTTTTVFKRIATTTTAFNRIAPCITRLSPPSRLPSDTLLGASCHSAVVSNEREAAAGVSHACHRAAEVSWVDACAGNCYNWRVSSRCCIVDHDSRAFCSNLP